MKEGWNKVKLGDVFTTINGLWTGKKEPFVKVNVYTMANFTKDSEMKKESSPRDVIASVSQYETRKLVKGDILIEKSGGGPNQPVGRAVFFDIENSENNTFSNFTTRLRLSEDYIGKVDSKFVQQYLKYVYITGGTEQFQNNSTNIRNLQLKEYLGQDLYYPSFAEQQRIVSILDHCFKAIDKAKANAEQNLQNAKELFESYLQGVFEKKGEGWKEITLGEIGKVSMCKRIYKKETSDKGEIPFYKIGTFGKEPNAFITKKLYDEYRDNFSFPKKGDIMLSASGTIGRRVRYDGEPAYFQDSNIVWIDNDEKLVSNDYLYFFYDVCDWKPSKGATISRLYNDDLRKMKISFPSLKEQDVRVDQFKQLYEDTQKLEIIYQKKLDDLEELKKSILQKAFAGELKTEKMVEEFA